VTTLTKTLKHIEVRNPFWYHICYDGMSMKRYSVFSALACVIVSLSPMPVKPQLPLGVPAESWVLSQARSFLRPWCRASLLTSAP